MKKILMTLVACMATAFTYGQGWYVGPQIGTGITDVAAEEYVGRMGFNAGVFGGYDFKKLIGIEMQVNYSLQGGSNRTYDPVYEMRDFRLDLHYITVPVLAKFNFKGGFLGYVGPQLGILTGAKFVEDANKTDIKCSCNSVDLGAKIGLGYQFKFGLRLMAEYTLGVTNIFNYNCIQSSAQNRVFAIKAGWRF